MALKLNERYPGRFDAPSAGYPQGAFKNRTTPTAKDGSYLEKDWANDKEGFFQSLISSSGLVPNGTADAVGASQYFEALVIAARKAASGVVGQTRNLAIAIAAASATATVTADEAIVETALGGLRYCLPDLNKTINLAIVGAGGMDTGAAPVSGFVAIYAIYNPATGASALLATNATAAVQPEVYGGANMPAGYTASALLAVHPTNGSGQLSAGYWVGRECAIGSVTVLTTNATSASYSILPVGSAVPLNAKNVQLIGQISNTSTGITMEIAIAVDSSGRGVFISDGNPAIGSGKSAQGWLPIITPQQLYARRTSAGGTPTFTIVATGYKI